MHACFELRCAKRQDVMYGPGWRLITAHFVCETSELISVTECLAPLY